MVNKTIELESRSPISWEDAVQRAVSGAAKTVRDIRMVRVREFTALVERDRIIEYRANIRMTFRVNHEAEV